MDTFMSFGQLAQILKIYGPFGLLVVIWYFDMRTLRRLNEQYRQDANKILSTHKSYMDELWRMYESNVKLVEGYEKIAGDFKELIIMNTQQLQRLNDAISQNQFCPLQRVSKKKVEVGQ
jgi:hypothetical protein